MTRTLRHLARLLADVVRLAREEKRWWLVPLVFTLLAIAALVGAAQVVGPYVYTLF